MKTKLLSIVSLLVAGQLFAQTSEMPYIGGNFNSSILLSNEGKVFAWGNNKVTQFTLNGNIKTTGILGVGSTLDSVLTPTQVVFPEGTSIKQVHSGSGNHFLALDCNTNAWAWGLNDQGQLGNGTTTSLILPAKVKAGAGPADKDGNLTQVLKVSGGNLTSFAILENGKALSWGDNNNSYGGLLGNNMLTDSNLPTYILDGTKPNASNNSFFPLEGVVQIVAGDYAAYALLANGQVYSWGADYNGTLGRAIKGGTYKGEPSDGLNGTSKIALPVSFPNGSPLINIASIAACDVAGMALDKNGFVWTWGNGGWSGLTGQGIVGSHTSPKRVVKGEATGQGTDGYYLLAKSISGGQGFEMAVTIDGKPMAWGNNNSNGGVLGNGLTISYSSVPVYIKNGTQGEIHNDVVSISRTEMGGFYTRADNSLFTWGNNLKGQLGIGNTTTQLTAVEFTIPSGATLPDPAPYAFIQPSEITICPSKLASGYLLDAHFGKKTNGDHYQVTWYQDSKIKTKGSIIDKTVLNINEPGTYVVRISQITGLASCHKFTDALDTVVVKTFAPSFSTPTDLKYCKEIIAHVTETTPSNNAVFAWYPNATSTTKIGISKGSENVSLVNSDLEIDPGTGDINVYVEEQYSQANQSIGPTKATLNCLSDIITSSPNSFKFVITAFEDVQIDSIDVYQKDGVDSAKVTKWQVALFDYIDHYKPSALAPYSITTTRAVSNATLRRVPVGLVLKGSPAGFKYVLGFSSGGNVEFFRYCPATYPYKNPNVGLEWTTSRPDNPSEYGHFMFNMQTSVGPKYCDRKAVKITQDTQCSILGLASENESSTNWIAPNPFKEQMTISMHNASKIRVISVEGRLVEEIENNGAESLLVGQNWDKGLYIVQWHSKDGIVSKKIIKE